MQYFKKPILNLPEIIRPGQKEKQIALCDEAIGLLTLNSNDNSIFEILKNLNELLDIDNNYFRFELFPKKIIPVLIQFILKNQNHSKQLPFEDRQSLTSKVELFYEYLSLWAHKFPINKELQPSIFLEQYFLFRKRQKDYKISMRKKNNYIYIKNVSNQTHQKYNDNKKYFISMQSDVLSLSEQSILLNSQLIIGSIVNTDDTISGYNFIEYDDKKNLYTKKYKNAQCTGQLKNYTDLSKLQKDIYYSILTNNKELIFQAQTNNNIYFQGKFSVEDNSTTLNITSKYLNLDQQIQILKLIAQKYLS